MPTGDFGTYGGLNFQGFQCANSFDKGDVLVSRTDQVSREEVPWPGTGGLTVRQGKCIKGSVKKDIESGPKISCDSSKSFSIKDFRISVTIDTDLVMVYGYENGDVCKHTAPCSTAGSTITNSQCGGATSVTFHLPSHSEHEDCDVGIHHVGFDCGPPVQPPSSSSTAASSPSASLIPYPSAPTALSISYSVSKGNYSTTPVVYSASSGSTSPSAYIPVYSSGVVPQPSASVPVYYTPSAGVPVYHSPSGGVPVYHSPSAPAVYGSSPSVPGASSAPAVNGSYAPYIPYVSASTQDVVTTKM